MNLNPLFLATGLINFDILWIHKDATTETEISSI